MLLNKAAISTQTDLYQEIYSWHLLKEHILVIHGSHILSSVGLAEGKSHPVKMVDLPCLVRRMVNPGRWQGRSGPWSSSSLSCGREICKEMISVLWDRCLIEGRRRSRGTTEGEAHCRGGWWAQMLGWCSGEVRSNIWVEILGWWWSGGTSMCRSLEEKPSLLAKVDMEPCLEIQTGTDL